MGHDQDKNMPPEAKLAKMEYILNGHTRHRKNLGKQLKQATLQMNGALKQDPDQKGEHTRLFMKKFRELRTELEEVKGKEAWARRMLDSFRFEACTRSHTVFVDGEFEERHELIHSPFKNLKQLIAS